MEVQTLHCNVSTAATAARISTAARIPTAATASRISTESESTEKRKKAEQMAKISPKKGSISTVVRSYKSATTKFARKINPDFEWQTRFHDHIIRNDKSFDNIHNYILNNPQKWEEDTFYKL